MIPKITYPTTCAFKNVSDFDEAVKIEGVLQIVDGYMKSLQVINIKKTMIELTKVGELVQFAYAASKGFKCSRAIVKTLSSYQTLIIDTFSVSECFAKTSLTALQYHSLALKCAQNENVPLAKRFETSLKAIARCAETAGLMVIESEKLILKAGELCKTSEEALLAATEDETISTEQKKAVEKTLVEVHEREEFLKNQTNGLQRAILEENEREAIALKEAKEARDMKMKIALVTAFALPLAGAVGAVGGIACGGIACGSTALGGLATVGKNALPEMNSLISQLSQAHENIAKEKEKETEALKEVQKQLAALKVRLNHAGNEDKALIEEEIAKLEIESVSITTKLETQNNASKEVGDLLDKERKIAEDRASEIAKRRAELQREQIKANADLAESITKLQNLSLEKDDLSAAISTLGLMVKTLGKVKTIFENTRLFWINIQRHCKELANIDMIKDYADLEMMEDFIEEIKSSGLNWLALGRINHAACISMNEVKEGVNKIMSDLPSKDEALNLIKAFSYSAMLEDIKEDTEEKL